MEVSTIRKLFEYDQSKKSILIFNDTRRLADRTKDEREEKAPVQCPVILLNSGPRRRKNNNGRNRRQKNQ